MFALRYSVLLSPSKMLAMLPMSKGVAVTVAWPADTIRLMSSGAVIDSLWIWTSAGAGEGAGESVRLVAPDDNSTRRSSGSVKTRAARVKAWRLIRQTSRRCDDRMANRRQAADPRGLRMAAVYPLVLILSPQQGRYPC